MYEQHERNFSIYVVRLSVTVSRVTQSLTASVPRHKVLRGGGLCGILIYFFFFKRGFSECSKAPDSVQHISEKK